MRFLTAQGFREYTAAIEIWNEPNARNFWDGGPIDELDAALYAQLYDAAWWAIRNNGGRRVPIVTAGLKPGAPAGDLSQRAYLKKVLTTIDPDRLPDGVGVHAYANSMPPTCPSPTPPDCVAAPTAVEGDYTKVGLYLNELARERQGLRERGIQHTPRWITEFGYPTLEEARIGNPPTEEEQQRQALTIQAMWQTLLARPAAQRPESMLIHRLIDEPTCPVGEPTCELEHQLMGTVNPTTEPEWTPKPSFCAVAALAYQQGNWVKPGVC